VKWEIRKVKEGWGIFLIQKYCKTKEPVCYGVSKRKDAAELALDRINNPLYTEKI